MLMVCVLSLSLSLQVAPRLAIAALAMREDRDARKSTRDVFSAGDDGNWYNVQCMCHVCGSDCIHVTM